MRIISGLNRGRNLLSPKGHNTRPTADKVKEAVFSVLTPYLEDAFVLDAFSGSGALALEALSRGAARAILVEKDAAAARVIGRNIELCQEARAQLWRGDLWGILPKLAEQGFCFDIIFLDPPYNRGLLVKAMRIIGELKLLKPDGLIVAESTARDSEIVITAPWQLYRQGKYGDTAIYYCGYPRTDKEE